MFSSSIRSCQLVAILRAFTKRSGTPSTTSHSLPADKQLYLRVLLKAADGVH